MAAITAVAAPTPIPAFNPVDIFFFSSVLILMMISFSGINDWDKLKIFEFVKREDRVKTLDS